MSTHSIPCVISGTVSLEWLLFYSHQGQSTWGIIKASINVKPLFKHTKNNSLLAYWVIFDWMSDVVNFTLLLIGHYNTPWNTIDPFFGSLLKIVWSLLLSRTKAAFRPTPEAGLFCLPCILQGFFSGWWEYKVLPSFVRPSNGPACVLISFLRLISSPARSDQYLA